MKISELRGLNSDELKKKELELREDEFRMRFKLFSGELENPAKLKFTRKDVARIKTILTQRETGDVNGK